MTRSIEVEDMPGGGSVEGFKLVDKKSYRVVVCEGGHRSVFEARITSGTLETLSDPSQYVKDFFKAERLPQATVMDIS